MSADNKKRFIISERRMHGEHRMAIGDDNYLCAFCSSRLTTLSNNSYGCFSCSCKYYDYTDSISDMIDNNVDITLTDIAEQLDVDIRYIADYVKECGEQLGKGTARICSTCGRVIMDGGECKHCALRPLKREIDYNAKLKAKKKSAGSGRQQAMHYIGRNKSQTK